MPNEINLPHPNDAFGADRNFNSQRLTAFLNGEVQDPIDTDAIVAPAGANRRPGALRGALISVPAIGGVAIGLVAGVAGGGTSEVQAEGTPGAVTDACPVKDGQVDPFVQVTVPLGYHKEGDNCVKDATVQPTGTPNGEIDTPTPKPHVVDACPKIDGVDDPFIQVTIPVTHEDPDKDGNCTKLKTPPPTGTPNGEETPTPTGHETQTPTPTRTPTETPTATATPTETPTPTRTPTKKPSPTPTVTVTQETCEGQIKVVKFHDRNENGTRDAGEEGLIWEFKINRSGTAEVYKVTTKGDGTYIKSVKCGEWKVTEADRDGWKATTSKEFVEFVEKNELQHYLFGNVQEKPGETPTPTTPATSTPRPTYTPEAPVSGFGMRVKQGFNWMTFGAVAGMGFALSGLAAAVTRERKSKISSKGVR